MSSFSEEQDKERGSLGGSQSPGGSVGAGSPGSTGGRGSQSPASSSSTSNRGSASPAQSGSSNDRGSASPAQSSGGYQGQGGTQRDDRGGQYNSGYGAAASAATGGVPEGATLDELHNLLFGGKPQRPYQSIIDEAARKYGLPEGLLEQLIQQESTFNPNAKSKKGAIGLTQLMPATAKELGVTDPYDPTQNIMAGAKYLSDQINKFGSVEKGLAAYNGGMGRLASVDGDISKMPAETQDYVDKITGNWQGSGARTAGLAPGVQNASYQQPVTGNPPEVQQAIADRMASLAGIDSPQPQGAVESIGRMLGIDSGEPLSGIQPASMKPAAGGTLTGVVNPDGTMGQKWSGAPSLGPAAGQDALMGTSPPDTVMSPVDTATRMQPAGSFSGYAQPGMQSDPWSGMPTAGVQARAPKSQDSLLTADVNPPSTFAGSGQPTYDTGPMPDLGPTYPEQADLFGAWGAGRPRPVTMEAQAEQPGNIFTQGVDAVKTAIGNKLSPYAPMVQTAMNNPRATQFLASLFGSGGPLNLMGESGGSDPKGYVRDPVTQELKPVATASNDVDVDALVELLFGGGGGFQLTNLDPKQWQA